ncbi:MAG: helix-turn-helix domain-containing protein [Candidatus Rokubacteria bacterium]|nr:helix-turn-helix domain-containing protein [Candidatus Rokubacteria bacterium]
MIALRYHRHVTGATVKRIRKALALTQREFAAQLGVHKVTVAKWETGAQRIQRPTAKLIELLGALATGASARPKVASRKPRLTRKRRGRTS